MTLTYFQESRDGQILFEVFIYLQKGCIIMSRVVSSYVADNSNHDSNIGVESHSIISIFQMYRVFSKARNAVGPSKSLIFWTFPGVLAFLDHLIWAIFHSGTFGTYD